MLPNTCHGMVNAARKAAHHEGTDSVQNAHAVVACAESLMLVWQDEVYGHRFLHRFLLFHDSEEWPFASGMPAVKVHWHRKLP